MTNKTNQTIGVRGPKGVINNVQPLLCCTIVSTTGVVVCRSKAAEARIQQMVWKVNYNDLVFGHLSAVRHCSIILVMSEQ